MTEMMELADKDFERAIVNILKGFKKSSMNTMRNVENYNERTKCNF